MSFLKNVFGNTVANEAVAPKTVASVDRQKQLAAALQEPIGQPVIPRRITYDLIKQTIVQVRVNELIGKGRLSKDEHLAEDLFCLVRHYEPDTKLTYERIMQAIVFVKSNDIMGAGQWSKEDHLAEYLYALVRLSTMDNPQAAQYFATGPEAKEKAVNVRQPRVTAAAQQPQQQPTLPLNISAEVVAE